MTTLRTFPAGRLSDTAGARGLIGGPFGSKLVSSDYCDEGIPVIRGQNLAAGRWVDTSDAVRVSEEKVKRDLATNLALPGDLIFTQRGTLGQVAIMPPEAPPAVVSQSQMRLRVDDELADSRFVYYWARSPEFLSLLSDRAIVSGVPHINLGILAEMPIPLPPRDEQRRIGAVLGALDDSIEANRNLNSCISSLQLAIFARHWDGECRVRLADIAAITMGQSPPGDTYNESGDGTVFYQGTRDFGWRFPGRRVWTTQPTRLARAGDILVSVRAPVGDVNVATEDTALGRGVCALRAVRRPSTLLQALLVDTRLWDVHQGTGTVFASVNKAGVENLMVPWVNSSDLEVALAVLDDAILQLTRESEILVEARDELLPLLMSGRVRVSETFEVA